MFALTFDDRAIQLQRGAEPEITEKETERSRQQAMAARGRATRTQLSAGQTNVQRTHKGRQPRDR